MTFAFWESIPIDTDLAALRDVSILVVPRDPSRSAILTVGFAEQGYLIRYARLSNINEVGSWTTPSLRLAGPLDYLKLGPNCEAIAIATIAWPSAGQALPLRMPISITAGLLLAGLLFWVGGVAGAALAIPAGLGLFAALMSMLRRRQGTRILTAGALHLDASNLVDYAIARRLGIRELIDTDDRRRAQAMERIDRVRERYGTLASDLVYRIDNPALFDSSAPTTRTFELALLRAPGEGLALAELEKLAIDLEITFSVARDHAETVGLGHLPEAKVAVARRASKAARLAASAGSEGERAAAMTQVIRILDSLALHYLPAPAGERKQLDQSSGTAASEV